MRFLDKLGMTNQIRIMKFPLIKNASQGTKLLTFMLLLVFGIVFSSVLGVLVAMTNGGSIFDLKNLQIIQVLNQVIGFLMPPVVYVMLVQEKPFKYLGFNKLPAWSILGIVAIFTVIPFLSMVTDWNDGIVIPESMRAIEEQLRNTQKQSEEIIKTFISQGSLCSSLLIIAALAAVSEELLFRSVIQKALIKLFKNAHVAIVVTAFVFSAVHMDFFGFFPRMILGIMLGYMFYLSGSIFPSILMHFVNNATIVLIYYFSTRGFIDIDVEKFGSTDNVLVIILSLIATVAIFIICNRLKSKNDNR
ncbi:MAG: CPBP family intramembrane metalloprotease [Bacteroidales bacterium]|nr:CPBP family intramembrane metalloprotease [Bacteroidales bacterium]